MEKADPYRNDAGSAKLLNDLFKFTQRQRGQDLSFSVDPLRNLGPLGTARDRLRHFNPKIE